MALVMVNLDCQLELESAERHDSGGIWEKALLDSGWKLPEKEMLLGFSLVLPLPGEHMHSVAASVLFLQSLSDMD